MTTGLSGCSSSCVSASVSPASVAPGADQRVTPAPPSKVTLACEVPTQSPTSAGATAGMSAIRGVLRNAWGVGREAGGLHAPTLHDPTPLHPNTFAERAEVPRLESV